MKRRRYCGVAAFANAAFQTVPYTIDMGNLCALLGVALQPGIWKGWPMESGVLIRCREHFGGRRNVLMKPAYFGLVS